MFDAATVGGALTSLKTIVDLVKTANDTQLAARVSREVIEAQGKLFDIQREALALQTENQQFRAEIENFRSARFHHSVNWRVMEDGSEDGPFCPVCVGEGVEMRLVLRGVVDQTGPLWHLQCPKTHKVGVGAEGIMGRGRELSYPIPKELIPENRYFLRS